jgi:hypothetical protein
MIAASIGRSYLASIDRRVHVRVNVTVLADKPQECKWVWLVPLGIGGLKPT